MEKEAFQEDKYNRGPYHWMQIGAPKIQYDLRASIALRFLGDLKGRKALDIGCGDGKFTSDILNTGAEVQGVDVSEKALRFAQVLVPEASFHKMDATKLDFPSESFDAVTLMDVIEHFPDEMAAKVIDEAARVLKASGTIIVSTPSTNLWMQEAHYRHYTEKTIQETIGRKFESVKVTGYVRTSMFYRKIMKYQNYPVMSRIARGISKECAPSKAIYLIASGIRKKP